MDLQEGIKRALDHDGILFLGSGFSTGGLNRNGEPLKVGSALARAICKDMGAPESDNLAISSQRYLDDPDYKKSLSEFIDFLKKEVYCSETSHSQDVIASVPWKRIYTTNYDNVFELATEKAGLARESITITRERYQAGRNNTQAIVHINGSILHLSEKTFVDEFKITDDNYNRDGLLQSKWVNLFDSDLSSSAVIFFLGYSLQYDQELVRHIANLGITDKCFFIDIASGDSDKEYKLRRYGALHTIGTDGFATQIEEVANSYIPTVHEEKLRGFVKKELSDYYSDEKYTSIDVHNLLVNGNLKTGFMNQEFYCVSRELLLEEIVGLLTDNDVIVIQSRLGNGKSMLLENLANRLAGENNVYWVNNLETMASDLDYIQSCSEKNNILLVDDYGYYTKLVKEIGETHPHNVKLIMTCRTSININIYEDLFEKYGFEREKVCLKDIDELDPKSVQELIGVLDSNRLWGMYDEENPSQKKKLVNKTYENQMSRVFYILLNSKVIKKEIETVINSIRIQKGLFEFILAQAINSICNLKFSYAEIREYAGVSDELLREYAVNKEVREVLNVSSNDFSLSSSIFAQYIVRESGMRNEVLNMLEKIYVECSKNDDAYGKFYQQRRNMISRSNIILLLNGREDSLSGDDEKIIFNYFDKIKNQMTASKNPFFWFQFGITALNMKNYDLASIYFENAYANVSKKSDFDTFQIDTHKARLVLCSEMNRNRNNPSSAMKSFVDAHNLLMYNSNRGEKMRYVFRQIGLYYDYFNQYKAILPSEDIEFFRKKSSEAIHKFYDYFSEIQVGRMPYEVCTAYIKFRKLFLGTPYEILLRDSDSMYDDKVTKKSLSL